MRRPESILRNGRTDIDLRHFNFNAKVLKGALNDISVGFNVAAGRLARIRFKQIYRRKFIISHCHLALEQLHLVFLGFLFLLSLHNRRRRLAIFFRHAQILHFKTRRGHYFLHERIKRPSAFGPYRLAVLNGFLSFFVAPIKNEIRQFFKRDIKSNK